MVRVDFIFSYWILFWYLLFMLDIIKINPAFAILCGLIENIIVVMFMIYYNTHFWLLFLFCIMIVLLKIIPLFTLSGIKIKQIDIFFSIVLFLIYLFWITYNNKNVNILFKETHDLIIYNKNNLPGMVFIDKLLKSASK